MDYTTSVDYKTSGKFKLLAIKLQKMYICIEPVVKYD